MNPNSGLTKTQRHVLQALAVGAGPLHVIRGMRSSCFLSLRMETVRWNTAIALERLGYIADYEAPEWRWRGSKYQITEAGRNALWDQ